jgi:hypothetical protein
MVVAMEMVEHIQIPRIPLRVAVAVPQIYVQL